MVINVAFVEATAIVASLVTTIATLEKKKLYRLRTNKLKLA